MTALVTGQNAPWPAAAAVVRVHASADLSALLLTQSGMVRDERDLVFYNAESAPGVTWRSVDATTQTLNIVLSQVDPAISTVRCLVSVDPDQSPLSGITVEVADPQGGVAPVTYSPNQLTGERCLITVELYRRGDGWKVRAVGQGWMNGLAAALNAHGIAVEEQEEPAPAPNGHAAPSQQPAPQAPVQPNQGQQVTQPWQGADTAGPDDDTVAGALRAINSIRADLSQACRAHGAALDYANSKMIGDQEEASLRGQGFNPAGNQGDSHSEIIAQAQQRFDQECESLRAELVSEELSMPVPLARLDSFDWEAIASGPQAPSQSSAIDTHDPRASVIRLGSVYPPHRDSIRVPMPHIFADRGLVWADAPDRPATGAAWARSIMARVMALTTPGAFDVNVIDLDRSVAAAWGQLGGSVGQDVTWHNTPAAASEFIGALAHQADLARMAYESRIEGALDDVRDGARHLLVFGHFPHGYDHATLDRLADAVVWAPLLDIQVIVLTDEQALTATLDDPADSDSAMTRILNRSLWLQDGPNPGLSDSAGVSWCFDAELTPSARSTTDRLLSVGTRGRAIT